MSLKHFCIAGLLAVGGVAIPAGAAVEPLDSLGNVTLQTLINLGQTAVSVGDEQFSHFTFINALPGSGVAASQVQVQSLTSGGNGLQFVSSWFAADGTTVDEVLTFDVQAADPTRPIGRINLFTNGTAPLPAAGTFSITTLVSQLPGGQAAGPVLSTYNDGLNSSTGTVENNYATTPVHSTAELHMIDTIFESSTAPSSSSSGGVALESIVQNTFADVPEPDQSGWLWLMLAALASSFTWRGRVLPPRLAS